MRRFSLFLPSRRYFFCPHIPVKRQKLEVHYVEVYFLAEYDFSDEFHRDREMEAPTMHEYKEMVRKHLSEYVSRLRRTRGLTQEAMAESLRITARAYGDLERGKFCFSATALMSLFLMLRDEEMLEFMQDFRKKAAELDSKEVA